MQILYSMSTGPRSGNTRFFIGWLDEQKYLRECLVTIGLSGDVNSEFDITRYLLIQPLLPMISGDT